MKGNFEIPIFKIAEDTGQKRKKHETKHKWFADNGIELVSLPLPVGDYILIDDAVQAVLERKARRGIEVKRLDLLGVAEVSVDTKRDMKELCGNLCNDHARFRDECILAQENGIQLIVLVEDGFKIKTLEDVKGWINPRLYDYCREYGIPSRGDMMANIREFEGHGGRKAPKSGDWMYKTMCTMSEKYGVRWEFCAKVQTGRRIIELLSAPT